MIKLFKIPDLDYFQERYMVMGMTNCIVMYHDDQYTVYNNDILILDGTGTLSDVCYALEDYFSKAPDSV